jgi:hypothetical protein
MPKLTYYYAERLDDSDCYSVVSETLRGARAQVAASGHAEYGPIEKKVLTYRNAFDLFTWIASEGGGHGAGTTVKVYRS